MTYRAKEAIAHVALAAYWSNLAAWVWASNGRFWLAVLVAYAIWNGVLQDLYCKLMGVRYTVVLECEGAIVTAREYAWHWSATWRGRTIAREYRHLQVGRTPAEIRVRVERIVDIGW